MCLENYYCDWDSNVLGLPSYAFGFDWALARKIEAEPGCFLSVKVRCADEMSALTEHGYYVVDHQVAYVINSSDMVGACRDANSTFSARAVRDNVPKVAGMFSEGRFFRDELITNDKADQRNQNWLNDILANGGVIFQISDTNRNVVGYFAFLGNSLCLNWLLPECRNRGIGIRGYRCAFSEWFNINANMAEIVTVVGENNAPAKKILESMGATAVDSYFYLHKWT